MVEDIDRDQHVWDVLLVQECAQELQGRHFQDDAGHSYFLGCHLWRGAAVIIHSRWQNAILASQVNLRHPLVTVQIHDVRVCFCSAYFPQPGVPNSFQFFAEIWDEHSAAVARCKATYDT